MIIRSCARSRLPANDSVELEALRSVIGQSLKEEGAGIAHVVTREELPQVFFCGARAASKRRLRLQPDGEGGRLGSGRHNFRSTGPVRPPR